MTYYEIVRQNKSAIIDKMVDMATTPRPYKQDLYIYPDGTLYVFDNVGGNSWLDDEHLLFWSVDDSQYDDNVEWDCETCGNIFDALVDNLKADAE